MCKNPLRMTQMTNADVMQARDYADELLRWETRGPGDTENAMRRLANRYALPFGKWWALRYRPPKEIASHVLTCIAAAHAAERQRQLRKLAHDIALTEATAGHSRDLADAARALVGSAMGPASPVGGESRGPVTTPGSAP